VHVLTFHQAGEDKWSSIGKEYYFSREAPLDENTAKLAAGMLEEMGLVVSIGGSE